MANETSGGESVFFKIPTTDNNDGFNTNFNSFFGFDLVSDIVPASAANINSYPSSTTGNTTNFNIPSGWTRGEVPGGDTHAIVRDGHTASLSTDATVEEITVNNNGTLGGGGQTLTVNAGGQFTNKGSFTTSGGTVAFSSGSANSSISGTVGFNNVTASTGVDFGSGSTINGAFTINGGGFVDTNPPTYGGSATLVYNTGGPFGRADEWSATTGAGHPTNVTIQNNTTLDLSNNGAGTARAMAGDLTITGVSELTMNNMSAALTVDGSVTVNSNGTLTLGSSIGGDLNVAGDFTMNGTLNDNGRAVTFDGDAAQTIRGSTRPIPIAFFDIDNTNGITIDGSASVAVSDELRLTNGTLTTNGNLTLTSTSETQTAYIAGTGSGSVSGDVTFERYFDKGDDASHFRFLAAPTATLLDDEGGSNPSHALLSNMWTQSETGTGADVAGDPSVFVYNESADLNDTTPNLVNGWQSIGQSSGDWGELNDLSDLPGQSSPSIDPGRGFLTFMFADRDFDGTNEGFPLTLSATGAVQEAENDDGAINLPITFTGGDGDGPGNNGWNLIANPFMAPIDWESIENNGAGLTKVDAAIYVWDTEAGQYATYTANESGISGGTLGGSNNQDQFIAPFQAFFVKASDSSPSIGGIDDGDKNLNQTPDLLDVPEAPPQVTLRLRTADDSRRETTGFRFTATGALGKDAYDAYQLLPLTATRTLVASRMDGTDALFDHQTRPVPTEQDAIDLDLDVNQSGSYVLEAAAIEQLPSDWRVILVNTDSGARYDLTAGQSVTFDYTAPATASDADVSPLEAFLQRGAPTVATASDDSDLPSFRLLVGPDAVLPVELAAFEAAVQDRAVALTWRTASEANNAGFTVERAVGAASAPWTAIGSLDGAGTTDQPQTYRFTDRDLPFSAERVRYRLRQVDLDGTETRSEAIAVDLGPPQRVQLHALFPNPVRGQTTVRYEVPETQHVRIALFDVLGRRVTTLVDDAVDAGRTSATLRTDRLGPGVYFLRMEANGAVHTQRLSVVR